ncbi:MAG: sigma-70 family RNA polymerase sigma factor [Bacteroidales bacterium]|nr:sigma-70 family RNA polymerase sigma factor [Bacteroidales bacterium]
MSEQQRLKPITDNYLELYSRAMAIVRDHDDACDALQEAIASTLTRLGHVRDPYLYCLRSLRNNCINTLRRRKRNAPLAEIQSLAADLPNEQAREAWAAKEQLPETQRALMILHDIDGYTLPELAALTGTSISTVKRTIAQAHQTLKQKLEQP